MQKFDPIWLSYHKRPPAAGDHWRLGLTLWVVAYGRFDCMWKPLWLVAHAFAWSAVSHCCFSWNCLRSHTITGHVTTTWSRDKLRPFVCRHGTHVTEAVRKLVTRKKLLLVHFCVLVRTVCTRCDIENWGQVAAASASEVKLVEFRTVRATKLFRQNGHVTRGKQSLPHVPASSTCPLVLACEQAPGEDGKKISASAKHKNSETGREPVRRLPST